MINNTQGWIFNHGTDRRLINATGFSEAYDGTLGSRGPRPRSAQVLLFSHQTTAPILVLGIAQGLFRAGGQRCSGISLRGGALAWSLIN